MKLALKGLIGIVVSGLGLGIVFGVMTGMVYQDENMENIVGFIPAGEWYAQTRLYYPFRVLSASNITGCCLNYTIFRNGVEAVNETYLEPGVYTIGFAENGDFYLEGDYMPIEWDRLDRFSLDKKYTLVRGQTDDLGVYYLDVTVNSQIVIEDDQYLVLAPYQYRVVDTPGSIVRIKVFPVEKLYTPVVQRLVGRIWGAFLAITLLGFGSSLLAAILSML